MELLDVYLVAISPNLFLWMSVEYSLDQETFPESLIGRRDDMRNYITFWVSAFFFVIPAIVEFALVSRFARRLMTDSLGKARMTTDKVKSLWAEVLRRVDAVQRNGVVAPAVQSTTTTTHAPTTVAGGGGGGGSGGGGGVEDPGVLLTGLCDNYARAGGADSAQGRSWLNVFRKRRRVVDGRVRVGSRRVVVVAQEDTSSPNNATVALASGGGSPTGAGSAHIDERVRCCLVGVVDGVHTRVCTFFVCVCLCVVLRVWDRPSVSGRWWSCG